jgi:hypothetical protein
MIILSIYMAFSVKINGHITVVEVPLQVFVN